MRGLGLLLLFAFPAAADPLVDELLPQVVKVMGLPAPKKLKIKEVTLEEARGILRKEIDPKAQQRLGEALLAVGLLPPGTKLEVLAPEFNADNVSAFYDLKSHTLFLIADQPREWMRPIVAHELAHAVQDANVDLAAAMQARSGSEDATLAFTAILEGQAQETSALVMSWWLQNQHASFEGVSSILAETRAKSADVLGESAPVPWLGLQLKFPYVAGKELISKTATEDDPIARELLKNPPASTAQVMDPTRPAPLSGELKLSKLLKGSKQTVSTTLGRAAIELLGAGEGWRGDRLEAVHVGKELAVVWIVVFDTEAQAEAFLKTLTPTLSRREKETVVFATSGVPDSVVRAAFRVFR